MRKPSHKDVKDFASNKWQDWSPGHLFPSLYLPSLSKIRDKINKAKTAAARGTRQSYMYRYGGNTQITPRKNVVEEYIQYISFQKGKGRCFALLLRETNINY